MRGRDGVRSARRELSAALDDASPHVRVAAAEALGRYGDGDDVSRALRALGGCADRSKNDVFVAIEALNAIDALGQKAAPLRTAVRSLSATGPSPNPRYNSYVPQLLAALREKFP